MNGADGILLTSAEPVDAVLAGGLRSAQTTCERRVLPPDRLSALEKALGNTQPHHGLLRGLLTDLRNCLSGAAGSLVATGAVKVLNMMLGTGVPAS